MSRAQIEDTYAEAFKSLYAEFLITARDRTWLDHALNAATGNGSSTILCDCEAGLERYVGPGGDESFATPDGRPGAIVQLHVPRFRKDRVEALERSLLVRISQNVLTCATAACFNLLDTDPYYKLGRKVAYFGDGHQFRDVRHGRRVWVIPILGGEFVVDRRFGYREGLMGGNIWYLGKDVDSALAAALELPIGLLEIADELTELSLPVVDRHRLAVIGEQLGLVVERIDVRRAAGGEHENHVLGLCPVMAGARRQGIERGSAAGGRRLLRQHARQGDRSESAGRPPQHFAPRAARAVAV